jgi:hypothetical protein
MYTITTVEARDTIPVELSDCRDCLQVLLFEYGDTAIENLAQLLVLTNRAEYEFTHHRYRAVAYPAFAWPQAPASMSM